MFTNFLMTMFLLVVRARIMNLRQDYLIYFRSEYLAMTLNQIIDKLPIKVKKGNKSQQMMKCVGEINEVEIFQTIIKLKLKQHHFEQIWTCKLAKSKKYISPDEAEEFMQTNMAIKKIDLYS